jgi:hypothetical protein
MTTTYTFVNHSSASACLPDTVVQCTCTQHIQGTRLPVGLEHLCHTCTAMITAMLHLEGKNVTHKGLPSAEHLREWCLLVAHGRHAHSYTSC